MKNLMQSKSRWLLCVAAIFAYTACGKSNYLQVGESAIIEASNGMILRSKPSTNSKSLLVIPRGGSVSVMSEGPKEKLFDIASKWYEVQYGGVKGWMWGGFAVSRSSINSASSTIHSSREKLSKLVQAKEPVIAYEDNRQYCCEIYASSFTNESELAELRHDIELQANQSGKATLVRECDMGRAREVFLLGPDENPPSRESELNRIREKAFVAVFDYDQSRHVSNAEYGSLLGMRGGVSKIK